MVYSRISISADLFSMVIYHICPSLTAQPSVTECEGKAVMQWCSCLLHQNCQWPGWLRFLTPTAAPKGCPSAGCSFLPLPALPPPICPPSLLHNGPRPWGILENLLCCPTTLLCCQYNTVGMPPSFFLLSP